MSISIEYILYAAYLVALVELSLGLYAFVTNPRRAVNRITAVLLLVFALNSLGVGMLVGANQAWNATLPTMILAFSAFSLQPLLILTSLFVLNPRWLSREGDQPEADRRRLRKTWIVWGLGILALLPLLLVLYDLVLMGGGQAVGTAGGTYTALYYTGLSPESYTGGYVNARVYTQGILAGGIWVVYFILLPLVLLGVLIYFILLDKTLEKSSRRFAWAQLIATVIASFLNYSGGNTSQSGIYVLLSGLMFAGVFVLTAYQPVLTQRAMQRGSLVYRITLLVLVVSLPLMVALVLFISSRAGFLVAEGANKVLQQQNVALKSNVETWLDLNFRILANLALQQDIRSMDPDRQITSLQTIAGSFPYMNLVSTSDISGMNIARSDNNPNENNRARLWFTQAMEGKPLSYQILLGRKGQPVLVVARSISEAFNVITGVVMFEANLDEISKQFQAVRIGETGTAFLVDDQNQLIAHPSKEFTAWLHDYSEYPPVQALRSGKTGLVSFLCTSSLCGEQGQARTAYVSTLSNGWGVIVEQSDAELMAPLRQVQQLAFVILVTGLLLLGSAVTFTVRQGLAPVKTLTDTVSAIAEGNLDTQVPLESGQVFTTADEMGFLAQTFNTMTEQLRGLIGGLEQRVEERTRDVERRSTQLEAAAQVARASAGIRDLHALLTQATQLITSSFGFYHAGIFISDEAREFAVLQASNSDGGQKMLARGHKLKIGQVGIVGYVASAGKARIALDVGEDAVFFNNPDLPETRSEMALPLIVNKQIIGVLDVQSKQSMAFKQEDGEVLQILADQLALAIENTRLLEETRRALDELRTIYSERAKQDWQDRLRRGTIAYEYTRMGVSAVSQGGAGAAPGRTLNKAEYKEGETASRPVVPATHLLQVPITLRDQKLGVITLRRDADQPAWNEEEQRVAHEAIVQIAAALENARLLESAQVRSTQLRLLQEVTAVAASQTNLHELLDNVAQKLRAGLDLFHCGVIMLNAQDKNTILPTDTGTLVTNACADPFHPAVRMVGTSLPVFARGADGPSPFEVAFHDRKTVVVYAAQQSLPDGTLRNFARQRESTTMLITPLVSRGQVIGFLVMDSIEVNRYYADEDVQLLDQISLQISSAMDVAVSFEQTTRRAEREQKTGEITGRIRETMDIDSILRTAAQEVQRLLDVPEVTVHLVSPEEETDASVQA